MKHMNTDHKDALVLLARVFARIEAQEAVMTAVDRLGFSGAPQNSRKECAVPASDFCGR